MSIINPRTGRHEDDLFGVFINTGAVPIQDLIEHLNECVVEQEAMYPLNVRTPVKMATLILEQLVARGVLDAGEEVRI